MGALVPPVPHDPSLPITLFDDPVGKSLILLCRQTYFTMAPSLQTFEGVFFRLSPPGSCVSAGG